MRGRYLGPTAFIGPHGRSGWCVRFGGRASLCATEHLRGVTQDEADCLGLDERRELDELLRAAQEVPENYEDSTSQPGPRHRQKFRQNHQGNLKSRHAMIWTDEIICRSLPEKRSDFWNRSAPRGNDESLEEETTHQQFERGSGRLSGENGS